MAWQRIPEGEWGQFLTAFSRQHDGWLVMAEEDHARRTQHGSGYLPLRGLSVADGGIVAVLGDGQIRQELSVRNPRAVRVEQRADGADQAIEIEGTGDRVLLSFRSPMLVEEVDGVP